VANNRWADYFSAIVHSYLKEGEDRTFTLVPRKSNVLRSSLNSLWFDIDMVTVAGRDHFAGSLEVKFTYSGGNYDTWSYGSFAIGSYRESSDINKFILMD